LQAVPRANPALDLVKEESLKKPKNQLMSQLFKSQRKIKKKLRLGQEGGGKINSGGVLLSQAVARARHHRRCRA
jgi:hypothetical protein